MPTLPVSLIRTTTTLPDFLLPVSSSSSGKVMRISGTGLGGGLDELSIRICFSLLIYIALDLVGGVAMMVKRRWFDGLECLSS